MIRNKEIREALTHILSLLEQREETPIYKMQTEILILCQEISSCLKTVFPSSNSRIDTNLAQVNHMVKELKGVISLTRAEFKIVSSLKDLPKEGEKIKDLLNRQASQITRHYNQMVEQCKMMHGAWQEIRTALHSGPFQQLELLKKIKSFADSKIEK